MDNKIIEALDYLGEKIGIAIDWTAENVYPQVLDFMARYKIYEIVANCIWIIFAIGYLFMTYLCIKKYIIPARTKAIAEKQSNFWFEYTHWSCGDTCGLQFGAGILIAFVGVGAIISVFIFICNISDIIKWIVIPEAQFYDMLKGVIN